MAQLYADRMFIAIGSQEIADVQSASVKQNHNRKVVPIMSRNRRNKGYARGNLDIDVAITLAVENDSPRPKFETIDYENNDVSLVAIFGADQLVIHGLGLADNSDDSSGPGEEVKGSFNFKGLDITDPIGNGPLFTISLG
jgi:hypothetical protein